MIKITSTNDVIIVEGDELTRHYPNNGTLVIPKNSTLVLLDEKSEMVLFKSASNYDTLFTGILGSISIEDELVTRENIIDKFNAISNVNVGGNVDLFEVVQSLPTENISDNKVYLVLDSNGSEGNTYVEYLYVNGQWEELGKFKVNVDLSGYALKTDILSAKTDSRYTDYEVENAVLSGKTILLQNEVTDSRKYHTLGFDKTFTVSSNGLLGSGTTLYRGSNEYNCPQWDGNTIRFAYQLGKRLLTRLTIPYTYNGVKYVTHFDIDVTSSQQYMLNFGVINDERFTDYQSVKFKESEVYKSFGANETFVFKNNNDIKDYARLDNSITSTSDFLFPNNIIEITVGNFPLTSSNGELVIETPRFYIFDNNVLTGGVQTESQTSEHPERLNDYIRYANDVKAYILTDKNTTFKTINGQQITGNGDIGLATKAELNTKQDTISDLQTIRSGASKGATALQSVPSTYALKTDILTANTDTRYTDYEVQNPVLSGKTIILQNEVTDSRKYHTFGYDKTTTVISNGLLKFSTPLYRDSNEYNCPQWDGNSIRFTYQSGNEVWVKLSIPYTYNGIKYVTHLVITVYNDSVVMWNSDYISDGISSDYQVVEFKDSEIYNYFRANGTFGIDVNGVMKDYDSGKNSPTAFSTEVNPGETVEMTVRNFPLTVQTGVFEIETPRFYISYNNVLTGNVPTEEDTSNAPERLNDYIRYANNVKAYILTDKNTTFKTINGQQITGEGNIEVSANVDLSNYATKSELNAKQDVITDLETIRSGAAKGATALQSVPSTYALKTDILTAKTDTRYTTYDVENAVLSGKTIVLQNEVTDSRKYHTFGFDKTVSELVKATNHINITRGIDNVPSMETDIESGISLNTNSNGFHNLSGSVTIPLNDYDKLTTILHYEVSYVERDSEGNVTGGSSTGVVDVTYDPNTKVLSYPIDSYLLAQITRTDTNKELFGGNSDGNAYQENGRECYSFEQHPLQEGGTLIWNPYYSDQYFWNYSVTIDVNSLKELQVSTDNKPERLNDYIRYSNNVKAYILTDKNTKFKTINGQQITGDGNITISGEGSADLSGYYTKAEIDAMIGGASTTITQINNLVV